MMVSVFLSLLPILLSFVILVLYLLFGIFADSNSSVITYLQVNNVVNMNVDVLCL